MLSKKRSIKVTWQEQRQRRCSQAAQDPPQRSSSLTLPLKTGKHWKTLETLENIAIENWKKKKFDPMIVMEDDCPAALINNRRKAHL